MKIAAKGQRHRSPMPFFPFLRHNEIFTGQGGLWRGMITETALRGKLRAREDLTCMII